MKGKKLLSLVLSAAMALSLVTPALAAEETTGAPWYQEAVSYVNEKGIMTGTDKGFQPEINTDRASVFQTLYNLEGKPMVIQSIAFPDTEGKWFATTATWAKGAGLSTGDENNAFHGERSITRAELVTILYRYAQYKKMDVSVGEDTNILSYNDAFDVAEWAVPAFQWACGAGLVSGDEVGNLAPAANASRAQLATMLMRFDKMAEAEEAAYTEETVSYTVGERTVPAAVTLPVGEGPFPAIVLAHGHGGGKEEGGGFAHLAQSLAENGFAVIRMDYPGCGDSTESFQENIMSNMIADTLAGVKYLTENYNVDADKLGILGYSMGGRIASQIAGTKENPFKAIVLLSAANVAMKDGLAANLFGSDKAYADLKAAAEKEGHTEFTTVYGQVQDLSKAWFKEMESGKPMEDLAKFDGPVLVLHGDADEMITDKMNKAILKAYPAAQEIIVPEADHGYGFYSDQPEVTKMVETSTAKFFYKNLVSEIAAFSTDDIDKYGDIILTITAGELAKKGIELKDTVTVKFLDKEVTLPVIPQYRYVGAKAPAVVMWDDGDDKAVQLEVFNGSFAETYGLATRMTREDGTRYHVANEGVKFPVPVTIEVAEKGGYADTYAIFDLTRTNDRKDYADLTDEEFANFRMVTTTGVGEGKLYRSSSPANPAIGRNTYADKAAEAAGVKSFINLADSAESAAKYQGYAESYYSKQNVLFLNLGVDFSSDLNKAGVAEAIRFLADDSTQTPVLVHCNEGQDRAGFMSAVLECLMGASFDEVKEDYMVTFHNYYGVEKGTDQYNKISNNIVKNLKTYMGVEDPTTADLSKAAESYLLSLGVTADEIAAARAKLGEVTVTGKVTDVSKYGNITTDITTADFAKAGFEVGDILKITVGDTTVTAPYGTGYSNVDTGKEIVLAAGDYVATAINMGNFSTTYKAEAGTEITYAMAEKAGYLEEYTIRNIDALRTNNREDYDSDAVFANFRAIVMGDIAQGKLFRSSSPVNPELGRNTYADAFAKANGIKTIIDLADSDEEREGYEGFADSYASTTNTVCLNMGVDFAAADFAEKLKTGLEYMIAHEGPYMVHCNEGKDRAGFISMLLECLMGGKLDEIVDDYMVTYENYYHVEHDSDRWNRIATSNVIANLLKLTGAADRAALEKANLGKAAETYLTGTVGLTAKQVTDLKAALSK